MKVSSTVPSGQPRYGVQQRRLAALFAARISLSQIGVDVARADVFYDIEIFYNRTRRHGHLGGVSPEVFVRASL